MSNLRRERAERLAPLLAKLIRDGKTDEARFAAACDVTKQSVDNFLEFARIDGQKKMHVPTTKHLDKYELEINRLNGVDDVSEEADFMARVVNEEEFIRFLKIDKAIYSLPGYDNEFLRDWRESFRPGCIGFFCNGSELAGGIGIWPLSDTDASLILEGKCDVERDIVPLTVAQCTAKPTSHWYLGGAFLAPRYRKFGWARDLMMECLSRWSIECESLTSASFEVLAIPINPMSKKFLKQMGFETDGKKMSGHILSRRSFASIEDFRIWAFSIPEQIKQGGD